MSPNKWNKHLAKERKRIQNYCKKVRETLVIPKSTSPLPSPYQTSQVIGEVIKKATQSLPSSPRKKQSVVKHLAKKVGLTVASPKKKTKNGLNDDTITKVKDFYGNNEMSWQALGCKDFVTIRSITSDGTRTKTTEQTCNLIVSLKEAYHHFMTMNLNKIVGLSKFCDLRPSNIKLFDSIPHICICIYHENMHLLLEVLSKYTKLSESFQDSVDQITCDPSFYDCNCRKCGHCIHLLYTFKPAIKQCENVVRYVQWKSSPKTEKN